MREHTGKTAPERVISPVITTPLAIGRFVKREYNAVAIAIPAEGPSLLIAPAGKWM